MSRFAPLAAAMFLLSASVAMGAPGARPVHVIVRGETTLDPDVIAQMSGLKEKPELTVKVIKERLQTSGLFSYVDVARAGDYVYIRVRQKFTFFVLPYISTNVNGTYYSVAGGKQIVLGEDALVAGFYQVGPSDHEGFALIKDGATLGSPVILELNFGYQDALHWVYQGGNIASQFQSVYHGGHLEFGYRIEPFLTASVINYVEQHRFQEVSLGPFQSGLQWSTLGQVSYDRLYKEEGLSNGYQVKIGYEETTPASDFHFWRATLSPTIAIFRADPLNWVLRGSAAFSPSLPLYQEAELGGDKLRGYDPEQFRDRYYGVIQNDFFLTSTNFWKLNVRSFSFADWGWVNDGGRPAAGAGIQVYPERIAISAFRFYVGYGFNPGGFSAAASLGSGFQ